MFREAGGFIAETLIFVVAGILIGAKSQEIDTNLNDWFLAIALYVGLHAIRYVVLFSMWPLLKIMGYGLSFNQIVILTYGGLRGAVGLGLALVCNSHETTVLHHSVKNAILIHTAVVASLTILINGNTTGILVKKLGLSKTSIVQQKLMGGILKNFLEFTNDKIEEIKLNEDYNLVDWYI